MTDAGHQTEALIRVLDHLTIAVACFAPDGRLVHQTTALQSMSSSADDMERLVAEARDFALTLAKRHHGWPATGHAIGDGICTRDRRHHLGASLIPASGVGAEPALLVIVSKAAARHESRPDAVRGNHRLTPRELDVARLLSAGESNQQIATRLRVSIHTVRHHTERVLRKLGVPNRAAVGAVMRRAS
jgi:DNA-binding CsgD family transcriptional regulator